MIPIVFWASLAPWACDKSAELASCAPLKNLSTRAGPMFWNSQYTATIRRKPASIPTSGEMTMNDSVCTHLTPQVMALHPALATAAPAYPPIRACDELDGIP